jgi:hypothetical protein
MTVFCHSTSGISLSTPSLAVKPHSLVVDQSILLLIDDPPCQKPPGKAVSSSLDHLHAFGCVAQVNNLRQMVANEKASSKSFSQANVLAWGDFNMLVNRFFKPVGLQSFRQNNARRLSDLLECDDSFVIVALLCAIDYMEGQHAVDIFNGTIYDANCE